MPSSAIERAAIEYRNQLLAREHDSVRRLTAVYNDMWGRIQPELKALLNEIAEQGGNPSPAQVVRLSRYQAIENQIQEELTQYGEFGAKVIEQNQLRNVALGEEHAKALAELGSGRKLEGFKGSSWVKVPTEQIKALVGYASDGSPLAEVLKKYAPNAVNQFRDALLGGLAAGHTPSMIAARLKDELQVPLNRALVIARTEDMRAYRGASIESFKQNSHIVQGWQWHASLSFSSCGCCLAMHGGKYPVTEPFGSHPNCRCIPVPFVDDDSEIESGEDWLKRQSEATQLRTLGPTKFQAWKDGKLKLSDLIEETHTPEWGVTRTEKSSKALGLEPAPRKAPKAKKTSGKPTIKPKAQKATTRPQKAKKSQPANEANAGGLTPSGGRIRLNFNNTIKGELGDKVQSSIEAIEATHGVSGLPRIPIKGSNSKSFAGNFDPRPGKKSIAISKHGSHPELTFAHETGHFIHHEVWGKGNGFTREGLEEVFSAIEDSRAFKTLKVIEGVDLSNVPRRQREIATKYVKYLLRDEEVFARAYAQYVATRSGNPTMLKQVAGIVNETNAYSVRQWKEADFEPIAKAFDAKFKEKRWLK